MMNAISAYDGRDGRVDRGADPRPARYDEKRSIFVAL
jgi:hypothetical protein